jgi:transcriptional regulator with GAF, ATPase, and Fis domain
MPPLSRRKEDIPLLVRHFVEKHAKRMGKTITEVPSRVMKALGNFPWPGNVRELENVVERAVVATRGDVLQLAESVEVAQPREMGEMGEALSDVERVHILKVLKETFWRIEGPNGAARILGLKPSTLRGRMKKLGIQKDRP